MERKEPAPFKSPAKPVKEKGDGKRGTSTRYLKGRPYIPPPISAAAVKKSS